MAGAYRFRDDDDWFGHWDTHESEFPELRSAEEYLDAANQFIAGGYEFPRHSCYKKNGDIMVYDPATNRLAIYYEDHFVLKTFHKRSIKQADRLFQEQCADG